MDALLAHPLLILALAWTASRLQILIEVQARVPRRFTVKRYLSRRWPQIVHSALWTVMAYGVVVATGAATWLASAVPVDPPLTPEQALAAVACAVGIAPDQIVDRVTSAISSKKEGGELLGATDADITRIAQQMGETTVLDADRAPTVRRED